MRDFHYIAHNSVQLDCDVSQTPKDRISLAGVLIVAIVAVAARPEN